MTIDWQRNKIKENLEKFKSNSSIGPSDPTLGNSLSWNASSVWFFYSWWSCNFRLYNFGKDLRNLSMKIPWSLPRTRKLDFAGKLLQNSLLRKEASLHSDTPTDGFRWDIQKVFRWITRERVRDGTRLSGPFRNKACVRANFQFEIKSMSLCLRFKTYRSDLFLRGKVVHHRIDSE